MGRGLPLAQRKARQSQVPARHDLEEGDCYNRLAKLGGQAGCREGPHREGQGGALGELGHLSGRCSDREEPRHFGSSRTSAGGRTDVERGRTEGASDSGTPAPRCKEA